MRASTHRTAGLGVARSRSPWHQWSGCPLWARARWGGQVGINTSSKRHSVTAQSQAAIASGGNHRGLPPGCANRLRRLHLCRAYSGRSITKAASRRPSAGAGRYTPGWLAVYQCCVFQGRSARCHVLVRPVGTTGLRPLLSALTFAFASPIPPAPAPDRRSGRLPPRSLPTGGGGSSASGWQGLRRWRGARSSFRRRPARWRA